MSDLEKARAELHQELGYKPLSKVWAKLEIFFGLLAVGLGIMLMLSRLLFTNPLFPPRPESESVLVAGLGLFVLGGYLALAGQRSHIYQSMNDHTALLLKRLNSPEGSP